MPYTTVVSGTTITASWGNASVRDQVVTPFANTAARSSAITAPVDGMLSTITAAGGLDYYDASVTTWRPPNTLFVRRTTDAGSIASNISVGDDSVLLLPVAANSTYLLSSQVIYTADPGGDLRIGWSGPASATLDWNIGSMDAISSSVSSTSYWGTNTIAGTDVAGGVNASSSPVLARPSGLLVTSSTAGTLKFRWAQGTSSAFGTQVRAGSWLRLDRVA
jgi:hypothetical protein